MVYSENKHLAHISAVAMPYSYYLIKKHQNKILQSISINFLLHVFVVFLKSLEG